MSVTTMPHWFRQPGVIRRGDEIWRALAHRPEPATVRTYLESEPAQELLARIYRGYVRGWSSAAEHGAGMMIWKVYLDNDASDALDILENGIESLPEESA